MPLHQKINGEIHHAPAGELMFADLAIDNTERQNVHSRIDLVAERAPVPMMRITAVRVGELVRADAVFDCLPALITEGDCKPSEPGEDGFEDFLAQGLACADNHFVIFWEVAQAEHGCFGGKQKVAEDEVLGKPNSG